MEDSLTAWGCADQDGLVGNPVARPEREEFEREHQRLSFCTANSSTDAGRVSRKKCRWFSAPLQRLGDVRVARDGTTRLESHVGVANPEAPARANALSLEPALPNEVEGPDQGQRRKLQRRFEESVYAHVRVTCHFGTNLRAL